LAAVDIFVDTIIGFAFFVLFGRKCLLRRKKGGAPVAVVPGVWLLCLE
jgi:hypothetical protein